MSNEVPLRPPSELSVSAKYPPGHRPMWGAMEYGSKEHGVVYVFVRRSGSPDVDVTHYRKGERHGWDIHYWKGRRSEATLFEHSRCRKRLRFGYKHPNVVTLEKNLDERQRLHGRYIERYENGNTAVKAQFRRGKLHGKVSFYRDNGVICESYRFRNGELHGIAVHYDDEGQKREQFSLLRGKQAGWQTAFKDGKPDGYAQYTKRGERNMHIWTGYKHPNPRGERLKLFLELQRSADAPPLSQVLSQPEEPTVHHTVEDIFAELDMPGLYP